MIVGVSAGSNAIQLAKHYKCDVTVTCSERNLEFVRAMGADHTIDYAKENWWEVGLLSRLGGVWCWRNRW